MISLRRSLLVMLLCLPAVAGALPLPEQVRKDFPDLRLAGEGRLRWLGLHIYDAALWTGSERWNPQRMFVLDIRYARDLSGRRLVETSLAEMRRLGFGDSEQLARWGDEMSRLFPDVRKGDHITGINLPGIGAGFYHQGRSIGAVNDPDFARAFFAIWLDERTREPRLRQALMGNG